MGFCKSGHSSTGIPLSSVLLLVLALCCGTTPLWAAAPGKARPASKQRTTTPAKPAVTVPEKPAVIDPCVPATQATPELPRNSTSALANLLTRSKGQEGASAGDPNRNNALARNLWSSRITAPELTEDAQASQALKQLIRQVHSAAANEKSPVQLTAPKAEPKPAQPERAESTVTAADTAEPPAQPEPAAATASAALPPKTQKTLENLRQNPTRVRDPLETAELLFLSGRPTDAVPFYEEALRHTRAGDPASGSDRAWILFQLGNCLRETDIAKAQDAYVKLIAEYPNSPWTEMARAGGRFLTWYQSTRPDQLTTVRKP
jgi:TolA-binding protein